MKKKQLRKALRKAEKRRDHWCAEYVKARETKLDMMRTFTQLVRSLIAQADSNG